jgi:flagellar biosynthesis protein FliP
MNSYIRHSYLAGIIFFILILISTPLNAEETSGIPNSLLSIDLNSSKDAGQLTVVLQIFILLTILSLAPAILIMLTAFTRIVIVLSILRQAIGAQQSPPNQVIIGLALFLTLFIMTPVWNNVQENAITPYINKEITQKQAFERAVVPIRKFMAKQTREKDIAMLVAVSKIEKPKNIDDIPMTVLIPSFVISELKTAFQMGFLLYIPFLILDVVISSILLSMGMMMLPPVMISLPFKLMLFVLADGWHLIVGSIVKSFG